MDAELKSLWNICFMVPIIQRKNNWQKIFFFYQSGMPFLEDCEGTENRYEISKKKLEANFRKIGDHPLA